MGPAYSYAIFREHLDYTTNMSYLACDDGDTPVKPKEEIRLGLENVHVEYRKVASILAMMEKGTPRKDLERMRREQLQPLELEIRRLEEELGK